MLGELVRAGLGEVELHLHHRSRTATELRPDLETPLGQLAAHGHLARDDDGRLRYAFIHGGWALANARDDGAECGVDDELQVLFETGCYADFTFPASRERPQPRVVNQIYWPMGDVRRRRPYDVGERAQVGTVKTDRLLMIEGPLAVSPAFVTDAVPGAPGAMRERVATWVSANIHVRGRPEWVFVKTHAHGAPEEQASFLLGDGGRALHETLTTLYDDGEHWSLHYVTGREMYNVAVAAMEGRTGNPAEYLDYRLSPPPAAG